MAANRMTPEIVLAIESGVAGGSVALVSGGDVLGKWSGAEEASRSEELLPRIAEMLDQTGVKSSDLSRIAVSNGPGSYTGLRIGLATAMGLARALGVPCIGVSLLKAIGNYSEIRGERIIVVPIGRNGYAWQPFGYSNNNHAIGAGNLDDLKRMLAENPNAEILAHADAFYTIVADGSDAERPGRITDLGRDLAVTVGIASASADDGLQPFYARDAAVSPTLGAAS